MNGSFNGFIVFLSILVAVYVSYIVVGICLRIASSPKHIALKWTFGGALAMATGIWAMHFIGMLAFVLPIPVHYDFALTGLSVIPAIFSSAIGLYMIRVKRSALNFFFAALLMGLGIAAMHYIGMAAMGMGTCIQYSSGLVILSVLIAIAASNIALLLLFHQIDNNQLNHSFKIISALIMGGAITGMHYVGMLAASFSSECVSAPIFGISLERDLLLVLVTTITLFILSITQMLTIVDHKISETSFYESVFKAQSVVGKGLIVLENEEVVLINDALRELFQINEPCSFDISVLEHAFQTNDFIKFKQWVKAQSHENSVVSQEFSITIYDTPRVLSAALVKFVHGDRIRFLIVTDDVTEKKQSELALSELNASLEQHVDKRTNELTEANLRLQESMHDLKSTQSELVQSQKMASLGSLVAGISHEINTPLGIGVTLASSIEQEISTLLVKYEKGEMKKSDLDRFLVHVKEGSQILSQNLHRASQLISSFKKVAVDQTDDAFRKINVFEYIEEIIMSLRPKLKKTQVTVHNNTPKNVSFYTKPGALYQIISNLIDNSLVHAFDENESGSITITSILNESELNLTYEDSGKGIDEAIRARIFDPFFTTRRGEGGSGLGLNIVYNLITSTLNGKVETFSKPNHGTRFEICLPISSGEVMYDKK